MARIPTHSPPPNRVRCGRAGHITALAAVALCAASLAPKSANAQLVQLTTLLTGTTYSVSIQNNSPVELGEVDLTFSPLVTLTGLSAPTGFQINYDQGSGSLAFVEDTAAFAPGSTVTPFNFTASNVFTPSIIEGLDVNGGSFTPVNGIKFPTVSGQSAVTSLIASPEPGSLGLLALGIGPGLALLSRRVASRRRTSLVISKG